MSKVAVYPLPEVSTAVVPELASNVQWPTNPETVDATVRLVLPLMAPKVALMEAVPAATALARPDALMVAVAGVDDDHVTEMVIFCVLESL